jgi:drug/metabolite transporter (DMT)-like permease
MALFLLYLLAFIWGSSFILMKAGLEYYSAATIGSLRILFAMLILLPFAINALRKPMLKHEHFFIALFGLIGSLIPAYLFAIAMKGINSSLAGLLNTTTPLFTVVLGVFLFRSSLNITQYKGVALGFLGSLILIMPGFIYSNPVNSLGHSLLILLATFMYGYSTNIIKTKLYNIKAIDITALGMLYASPVCILHVTLTEQWSSSLDLSQPAFWSIFILGTLGTALALVIFNQLVRLRDAVFAASVTYIIPVIALIWGYYFNETITAFDIVGIALTLLGINLINSNAKQLKSVNKTVN